MGDARLQIDIDLSSEEAKRQLDKFTLSVGEVERALKELKAQRLNIVDDEELKRSNASIAKVTETVKNLKNVGVQGFDEFGKKIAGLNGPIQGSITALRQFANLIPGIGVSGLIGIAIEGIGQLFTKTEKGGGEAAKALKQYNEEVSKVVAKTAEESGKVDVLVNALKKGTLSRKESVEAIAELQKIAPNYFGTLDREKSSLDQISLAYSAYNAAILRTIETQLKMKEITDNVQTRLDFERVNQGAAATVNNLLSQGKTLEDIAKSAADALATQSRSTTALLQSEKGRYANAKDLISGQELEAAGILRIIQLRQKEQAILNTIHAQDLLSPVKEKSQKTPLDIEPKISYLHENIVVDPEMQDGIQTTMKKLDKYAYIKLHFDTKSLSPEIEQLNQTLGDLIQGFEQGLITSTADAIGTAIGSGGNVLKASGKAILTEIGGFLKDLGAALIKASIAKKIALEIATINPFAGIAAGIAAEIAGAAIIASATREHAFADGGLVTGPTHALIGEAGPEVIFPLSKINQFMKSTMSGGGSQNVNVTGRIKGHDLILAVDRARGHQSLV
jgi:hypothetical protein